MLLSPVVGETDLDGTAAESGAGPLAGAGAPAGVPGAAELTPAEAPELPGAPPPVEPPPAELPPDAPPPAWASAPAQPRVRDAAKLKEMTAWRMGVPSELRTLRHRDEFKSPLVRNPGRASRCGCRSIPPTLHEVIE